MWHKMGTKHYVKLYPHADYGCRHVVEIRYSESQKHWEAIAIDDPGHPWYIGTSPLFSQAKDGVEAWVEKWDKQK